jgi:hypothetical protein
MKMGETLDGDGGTAPWKVSMKRSDTTEIFSSKAFHAEKKEERSRQKRRPREWGGPAWVGWVLMLRI